MEMVNGYLKTFAVILPVNICNNELKTTNKMTTASKQTFSKPENQLSYWTHRNICYNALKNDFGMTYREVAHKVRLKPDSCWKRLSELHSDGKIKVIGERIENGNANSVYAINNEPELFTVKKLTLREWMKKEHPEILHKYDVLFLREL